MDLRVRAVDCSNTKRVIRASSNGGDHGGNGSPAEKDTAGAGFSSRISLVTEPRRVQCVRVRARVESTFLTFLEFHVSGLLEKVYGVIFHNQ